MDGQHDTIWEAQLGLTPPRRTSLRVSGFPISQIFLYNYLVIEEDIKAVFPFPAIHLLFIKLPYPARDKNVYRLQMQSDNTSSLFIQLPNP
jgi:hypothetical protein